MMKNETIAWVDWLRVIACFLVVLAHSGDPFVAQSAANEADFMAGAAWGSAVRCCVPLFVMITGMLLMPVEGSMSAFYGKRLPRVIVPLVVWSIIAPLAYYFYLSGVSTANPAIAMTAYTAEATTTKMWTWLFNFNYDTTPLWYLYMLVGLYLFMPIISAWVRSASKKDLHIFLLLWAGSMLVPYLMLAAPSAGYAGNYGSMDLFGGCLWNPYGTFYYFSGFLGYLVFAYYLRQHPIKWSTAKLMWITIPLFALGYALTFGGFLVAQDLFPGDYTALEIPWYFSGINVGMMTVAAYLVIQRLATRPSKFITRLATLTFGIYLCHFFVVQVAYDLLYEGLPMVAALKIPVIAMVSFIVSAVVIWILSKLPFRKYLIG